MFNIRAIAHKLRVFFLHAFASHAQRFKRIRLLFDAENIFRLHLFELGFVVGSEVTVVNEIAGNLIVQVKQSRLALDKTMASRIMVS